MKTDPKRHLLIGAAIGGALLLVYGSGLLRWLELEAEKARLESEVTTLKAENQRLYQETKRLREDPAYAEEVARRQMGFVRPGETKIKFTPRKESAKDQNSR